MTTKQDPPVAIRLPPVEWLKLMGLIGAQLVAVVVYVQRIDHKATDARETAMRATANIELLRDRTEAKLEKIADQTNRIENVVTKIQTQLEQRP